MSEGVTKRSFLVHPFSKAVDPQLAFLESLLSRIEGSLQSEFYRILISLSSAEIEVVLQRFLDAGDIEGMYSYISSNYAKMADLVIGAYVLSGQDLSQFLSDDLKRVLSFDMTTQNAINHIRNIRANMLSVRAATQDALVDAMRLGLNPKAQARTIRDTIGLGPRHAKAVANYRRMLETGSAQALDRELRDRRADRRVQRAINGNTILTPAQVDSLVERYRKRMVAYRARTIARTEALSAMNAASNEMRMQIVALGLFGSDELDKVWNTARDEKVRGSHATMDGQLVAVDEPFISGGGSLMMYPGDPAAPPSERINCRCISTTRFKQRG